MWSVWSVWGVCGVSWVLELFGVFGVFGLLGTLLPLDFSKHSEKGAFCLELFGVKSGVLVETHAVFDANCA